MSKEIKIKLIDQIHHYFPDLILKNDVSWSELTTLGVGSSKPLVVEPVDDTVLPALLRFCYNENITVLPVGGGSNIVGSDCNFSGIVLKLKHSNFSKIKISHVHVTAGSGVKLYDFILKCAEKDLGGIAELAGIPGTIGGSLRTNAGRLGVSIGDFIEEVCGLDKQGNSWSANADEITWGYRSTSLPKDIIITAVIFKMNKIKSSATLCAVQESIAARKNIYPKARNAGCVFKNPIEGHGAGKLIDIAGCKGLTMGDAEVSPKHANFIVNNSRATEKDFLDLTLEVKRRVLNQAGIYLKPEVFFANKDSYEKLISTSEILNVAVLKGGSSHERAVSLESAKGVATALKNAGYKVKEVDIQEPKVTEEIKLADVVFPMLHGGFGEDGRIQKELENHNLCFVGCNSTSSEIIIDKIKTKLFFKENNIPAPDYAVLEHGNTEFPSNLSLPVVVKPPCEGSTFGVSIVKEMSEWNTALKYAENSTGQILVEEYIEGYELTVGIFDGKVLPIVHILYPGEMYDYDAKYIHETGETKYITPPDYNMFPVKFQKEIQEIALRAYKTVNAKDMLRVDLIVSKKENKLYFIEMNSIPGFTSSSLLPKAAASVDIPYIQLCGKLVQLAASRKP